VRTLLLGTLCAAACWGQAPAAWKPLTAGERLNRYWQESFASPGLYFAATGAAIGMQFAHDPPEWGKHWEGYAKRSASNLGLFAAQTTIYEGGAALMGLDPRYERCGCTGVARRAGHAFKWSFVTRDGKGRMRMNVPIIAASYGSGMLTSAWYPDRFHPATDGLRTGHQQLAVSVGINVIREFGPELKQGLRAVTPPFLRK